MRAAPDAWTAVVNPAAGRGAATPGSPTSSTRSRRAASTSRSRCRPTPTTSCALAATRIVRGRGVVACGGDGTVCALAGVAADGDGVLGIVPVGSGNDFARQLEIPRGDLDAAIDVLRTGRVVAADLGRVHTADGTTTWFTTVANTGFDAAANEWANHVTWTSGTPLYVLATLRTLGHVLAPSLPHHRRRHDRRHRAWLVAVGNTRTYASGMMITPAATRARRPARRLRRRARVARSTSCARSRRCSAARTSTIRRCARGAATEVTVEALDAAGAGRPVGER